MKVFVTGGTGFVGQEIIHQLLQEGSSVRALVRAKGPQSANRFPGDTRVEAVPGDVLDPESLLRGMAGCEAVVHLVGIISEAGTATFENVHTRGTHNVLVAAEKVGLKRFVHMSALGTRPGARSRYHQTKWAAEEAVRASGLNYTIFRPSLIYGPHDHFVNLFAEIVRNSPVVPVMGRPDARLQPVHVEEVASAFAGALAEPRCFGRTLDLCGHQTFTLREIVQGIQKVLQKRRWNPQVPMGVARAQAAFLEWFYPVLLRRPPPLSRDQLLMLEEDNMGTGTEDEARKMFRLPPNDFQGRIAEYLLAGKRRAG
jgi:NADH dehydrogenase